ncbi:PepSY-associated TM helix domain-containing protein [Microvirga rosea]|uniref:PepSY-associated TM helix domain-containing protein n=1 Tax=Microvirga rosea TaxID=2715425 RepID=UPI001D0B4294|nr:PepSY-associated TM helix domain-containing protein [Microvirga rosea]MCB8821598.1 PepSY domain-containing protein [Microvirga rosea]
MLNKAYLLRLHRWISLIFSLPVAVVIATGLILSFEPVVSSASIAPGSVTVGTVEKALAASKLGGKAQGIALYPYENAVAVTQRGAASVLVDVSTGQVVQQGAALPGFFLTSRRLHETLLINAGWLVTLSTYAMLVLMLLGILMGWPRIRNTLSGWHKGAAWSFLPLLIISPLTGLFLAHGVTLSSMEAPRFAPVPLIDAVRMVGADHDLSRLNWIRTIGGRTMARIDEGGMAQTYAVTPTGVVPAGQNWPRLIHEGNFAGVFSGLMNAAIALVMVGLMATGLLIWGRRTFRRRAGRTVLRGKPQVSGQA